MTKRVRLAIVGGRRGFSYTKAIDLLPDKVELLAICDQNPQVFERWLKAYPGLRTETDYQTILDDPGIDAVYLATPMLLHAEQTVQALNAGKHVLCEVASAHTIEGCWEVIEAVERTGLVYMLAENFCYSRMNLLVRNMAEQGAFGELTHAECGYIHDVRAATHTPDGRLTWRGELLRDFNCINYPTHSLGPVAQWLGINRTDSFDFLVSISSKPASQAAYFRELFGDDHPGADPAFWSQGDSALTLIRTKGGVVIYMRNDFSSPRPWNYLHYGLQGTRGAFVSGRDIWEEGGIWLQTAGSRESTSGQARWQPLWSFAEKYEHPWWLAEREKAEAVSSMFGDYFIMKEFASAILESRPPDIDVYDAVAVSSVFPLSAESIRRGGEPVSFPNFARNKPALSSAS